MMRRTISRLMLIISFTLTCQVVFANADIPVYCPTEVVCTEDNNLASCSYDTNTPAYWGKLTHPTPRITAGKHKFLYVTAGYHKPYAVCIYENIDKENSLYIQNSFAANIELFEDKINSWIIDYTGTKSGSCYDDPKSCPLRKSTAIGVYNNSNDPLSITTAGCDRSFYSNINKGVALKIDYSEALSRCGTNQTCKFNVCLHKSSVTTIGTFIIDMDNRLKILEILPVNSEKNDMLKMGEFNTIEVTGIPEAVPLSIKINLSLPVLASVKNKGLQFAYDGDSTHAIITADALRSVGCKEEIADCVIDFATHGGGPIGSINLHMNDNLKIFKVISFRPSEIIIDQTSANSIDIKYAYFNK